MAMRIDKVYSTYFSPTGTSKKAVNHISDRLAKLLDIPKLSRDFTLPDARRTPLSFQAPGLVVFGLPTIAGRVPNLLIEYLKEIDGQGCLALPIVMFGNRNFDNALIELSDLCIHGGMKTIAAAAIVGEHSFSSQLGRNRPDPCDLKEIDNFADKIFDKLKKLEDASFQEYPEKVQVPGQAGPDYGGYYMPQDSRGRHIDIRKVKPVTDMEACTDCKICYNSCPMGSIDYEDVSKTPGVCIKCCACIKKCPEGAKSFKDKGYIYHKKELEKVFAERASNSFFL